MRVFATGATGFIGMELVKELVEAGHQVRGLTRSLAGVELLEALGVEAHRGDLTDLDSLRSGARGMDAVVNLAFNHDVSKFAENAGDEITAIETLGSVLEPGSLLMVTNGIGAGRPGHLRKESDPPTDSPRMPRRLERVTSYRPRDWPLDLLSGYARFREQTSWISNGEGKSFVHLWQDP